MRVFMFVLCIAVAASANVQALVLSTIKPIDLLVRDLTSGDPASFVLLDQQASPHHYSMSVADVQRIKESDLVIWVGPGLETFLTKALKQRKGPVLSLSEALGQEQSDHHHHHQEHEHLEDHGSDAHLWLSYANGVIIAHEIAEKLSELYPTKRALISANLETLEAALAQEKVESLDIFSKIEAGKGFAVYHDGYSAFVEEFELNQLAHVKQMPEQQLSAKVMFRLKTSLSGASCILGEQAEFPKVEKLAEKIDIRPIAVDLLAANIHRSTSTDGGYFVQYMRQIRQAFVECLSAP